MDRDEIKGLVIFLLVLTVMGLSGPWIFKLLAYYFDWVESVKF